jgi:cytochrome c biogenesis protein
MISFFYPTVAQLETGAYTSIYPDPIDPLLTFNVYTGDLGLDSGIPRNVYALDVKGMELVAGRDGPNPPLELRVGDSVELPNGLGSVSFDGLLRYASLDVAFNPGGIWVLIFSFIALFAIVISLSVVRRRVWVRIKDERIEYAGLARGDDAQLQTIVREIKEEIEGRRA